MSRLRLNKVATPATPAANKAEVFVQTTNKHLSTIDDAGVVRDLVSPALFQPKDVEGTVYIDPANSQGWAGADAGAWINSAYAYLKATYGATYLTGVSGGGVIRLAPGRYDYTTPIVCATQYFAIKIIGSGDGVTNASPVGGTVLNYTATIGIAMTLAGASANMGGVQLEDIGINGTGIANSATGLKWGLLGSSSTAGATAKNVAIWNFGTGETWETNTNIAYAVTHINCKIQNCTVGAVPYGEANVWLGGLIGNCTTGIGLTNNGTDVECIGTAFDDNTTTAVSITQTLARLSLIGCRFENAGLLGSNYITQTSGVVTIVGGSMQEDNTTGGPAPQFVNCSGGQLLSEGVQHYSGGRVVTQAYNVTSTGNVTVRAPLVMPGSATAGLPAWLTPGISASLGKLDLITQLAKPVPLTAAAAVTVITSPGQYVTPAFSVPANTVRAGTTLIEEILVTNTGTAQNTIIQSRFGTGGVAADTAVGTPLTATGTAAIGIARIRVKMTFRTIGAAGTADVSIELVNLNGAATGFHNVASAVGNNLGGIAVNTTVANFFGVTLQAGTTSIVTVQQADGDVYY